MLPLSLYMFFFLKKKHKSYPNYVLIDFVGMVDKVNAFAVGWMQLRNQCFAAASIRGEPRFKLQPCSKIKITPHQVNMIAGVFIFHCRLFALYFLPSLIRYLYPYTRTDTNSHSRVSLLSIFLLNWLGRILLFDFICGDTGRIILW